MRWCWRYYGDENSRDHIDDAIAHARELLGEEQDTYIPAEDEV